MQSHFSWEKQPQLTGDSPSFPLSHGQRAMWFLYQIAPQSSAYNIYTTVRIGSELDLGAWHRAWLRIVERHQALRTTYTERDGQPVQVVHLYQEVDVKVTDASSWSDDYLKKQILAEAECPYNLETGPVLRVHLFTRSVVEHIQLLAMHHIAGDMWSFDILLDELRVLYAAEVKTLPQAYLQVVENSDISNSQRDIGALPNLPYTDYVRWQTEMLASSKGEQLSAYWQKQLAGELPLLELPMDKPRPREQTYCGASHIIELDKELLHKLRQLSEVEGTSLYRIILAAFFVLLYRYTGQEDIPVGSPMAGRWSREEFQGIVGYFTSTVVCRANLAGNPTFKEFLAQVSRTVSEAREHQDYPFPLLVKELSPDRDTSRHPLFQVFLTSQKHRWFSKAQKSPLEPGKTLLVMSPYLIEGHQRGAAFDLNLAIVEAGSSFQLCWQYNTDLFDDSTIARQVRHFQTILAGIVSNPEQRVSQLPLLTSAESYQLLVEWNETTKGTTSDKCIHHLFEEQVERSPDAIALVFEEEQLTYRELNQRANKIAHHLRTLGVGPEVLVGICVERSLEMVVGLLGILKAGGAYVPLDPEYPTERLSFMLQNAQVSVLLTQQRLVEKLPESKVKFVYLDTDWQVISRSEENPITNVQATNLAYVIYTSGSTGQPKGVPMNHFSLGNLILWQLQNTTISSGAKTLQFAPVSFDVSFQEMFSTWCSGGTLLLIAEELRRDPLTLLGLLQQKAVERLFIPFVALQQIAEVATGSELVTSYLREIITAGEQLQITPAISNWLSKLNGCTLHNHYGPSESHVVTTFTLTNSVDNWPLLPPIGRPIANTQIYILDSHLQPVPISVPGELYIGGAGLARGYLNRPDLTQEKFIPNPFSNQPGSRLYKTGDKARYLSDGNIEFLGRLDNQVKIRGFRIELGEVEAALAQYPGVRETAVIAREDIPGRKYLAAYIVGDGQSTTIRNLRGFLKQKLPDYMIPSTFVMLSALPLTPNGKVDRRALPTPEIRPELQLSFIAPRTPIEEIVASIWVSVLRIELVGVHDNFFELGGHSLLATQVISRVRDTFAVELTLRSLFEAPTIAEFAERVENSLSNGQSQEAEPLLPIPRSESIPLSFAQARLWFLDQLQPNSAFYNIPFALRLSGQLNIEALQSSINEIIRRHEALRTNFTTQEGQPVAVIAATLNCQLQVVNLLHIRESSREIEAQRLASVEANRPFNLEREPLLRSMVLQLGETEYVLLFTMHHIISDGWSLGVFTHELTELYKAFCTGITPVLPSLPVQYADFALWQRQWLQGEKLEAQLDYWKQQLLDDPALLELPTDRPRPADQTYRGRYHYAALSLELSGKLSALSKRTGVTQFMTLLAAFVTLLSRITSSDDIVVGTPVAGRNRQEIEGLIGFFVNTLVLRTHVGGDPSFEDVLSRVREVALGAYTHQDLPFEQLVEALQPTRSLSYSPLFQVMFALDEKSVPSFELPELTVSSYYVEIGTAKFDLTLSMENTADGLVGVWEYNVDLFDETTIARMARHFQTLLEGIVTNPQARVSELPLFTIQERHQLLVEWNNTTKEYPEDKCIHQLFEEQVERSPDAVAVVFEDKQLTYRELNQRANKIAHHLKTLGVGPEVLVGLCVERSLEMIVGLLGILKAGGAYVPLDPEYPTERLAYMLSDSQVSVLLTQPKLADSFSEHGVQVVCLEKDWGVISQESEENPVSGVKSSNLAYTIYTSGSTGKPKGVMISHKAICNHMCWMQTAFPLTDTDKVLQKTPFSFDASIWEFYAPLLVGAQLVMARPGGHRDNAYLIEVITELKITNVQLVPSLLGMLLESEKFEMCKSLKRVFCGGEALPMEHIKRFSRQLDADLHNLYGPTEATIDVTFFTCKSESHQQLVPIGRPIANTQIYILDPYLQPVGVGVAGELYIGGDGLARGYLNRPDLTQEKFISNPFSNEPGLRLYKTGDLARYLPDGNIEYLCRIDNQVKIRGFRIELGEIEAALAQYPGVRETAVIAREDVPGRKYLAAYIVPNRDSAIASSDLRGFLKEKLPDYMIPGAFVMLDALPLTPNGKVDRKALPIPDAGRPELSQTFVAPSSATEELLAEIWIEILGVEKIGIHDNFFDLGGHSLRVIQVVSRIRQTFDLEISVRHLFQNPTISKLIEVMAELAGSFEIIDEIARTIKEISQLSPEQVQAMLALTQENG